MKKKKKVSKELYCELFDTHDWEIYRHTTTKKGWFVHKRCKRCGKKKKERQIVMIPSVFSKGRWK